MPRLTHIVECDYSPTFRTAKVAGMFDVSVAQKMTKRWDVNLPIEDKPWQIGLIVGASGSGKTTLAQKLFDQKMHKGFTWKANSILDDFPAELDVKTITETLSHVGFSSPPAWLLPYGILSNGQKFRVELARCLLEYEGLFVFDEFTSVVDRQVAQIGAFAFQKAIRKTTKQFVAVTCHYDVEEWLQPDWVFDVSTNQFKWGSLQRPSIPFEICRVNYKIWQLFKDHHYLTADINKAAFCFLGLLNGRPVAFDAWLPFFGRLSHGKGMRGHRTVVLPDFQGLGLGSILFTTIAKMWKGVGYRAFSRTAHPAEIRKRIQNKDWKMTHQGRTGKDSRLSIKHATNRLTCGFEYRGEGMPLTEARNLLHAK